jgi:hypothetical protein
MKLWRSRTAWGVLLVALGGLLLLESLQVLTLGAIWALFFVAAGLTFGYEFLRNRAAWWAVIPAMALIGIGGLVALDSLAPRVSEILGPSFFLLSLGLGFLIVYLTTQTQQWWAILPTGVLISLAIALVVEPLLAEDAFAGLFLMGLALTFALLYFLPNSQGQMSWALIPATALAVISVMVFSTTTSYAGLIWPILLILFGVYILLRSLIKGPRNQV